VCVLRCSTLMINCTFIIVTCKQERKHKFIKFASIALSGTPFNADFLLRAENAKEKIVVEIKLLYFICVSKKNTMQN